eukprot:1558528-Pyramimonas_sp.AAC.1
MPSYAWVPAHLTLDDFLERDQWPVSWWFGNMWAGFFAEVGARSHKVADSFVEYWADQLAIGRSNAKFFLAGLLPSMPSIR